MDNDSFYVPEEDDDGSTRTYFQCVSGCPVPETCSHQAFSRVATCSFKSREVVLENIKNHLMNSSLHFLDENAAEAALEKVRFEDVLETVVDREGYRAQLQQSKGPRKRKGHGHKGEGSEGAHGQKRPARDDELLELKKRLKAIEDERGQQPRGPPIGAPASSASNGASSALAPRPPLTPPRGFLVSETDVHKYKMMVDCLERGRSSAQNCQRMLTQMAAQLAEEAQVLSAAKEFIATAVRRMLP